jgi:hypothetical protein
MEGIRRSAHHRDKTGDIQGGSPHNLEDIFDLNRFLAKFSDPFSSSLLMRYDEELIYLYGFHVGSTVSNSWIEICSTIHITGRA